MSSQLNTYDSIMFVNLKHIFFTFFKTQIFLPILCFGVRIAKKKLPRFSLTSKFIKQRSIDHNAPKGKSRSSVVKFANCEETIIRPTRKAGAANSCLPPLYEGIKRRGGVRSPPVRDPRSRPSAVPAVGAPLPVLSGPGHHWLAGGPSLPYISNRLQCLKSWSLIPGYSRHREDSKNGEFSVMVKKVRQPKAFHQTKSHRMFLFASSNSVCKLPQVPRPQGGARPAAGGSAIPQPSLGFIHPIPLRCAQCLPLGGLAGGIADSRASFPWVSPTVVSRESFSLAQGEGFCLGLASKGVDGRMEVSRTMRFALF